MKEKNVDPSYKKKIQKKMLWSSESKDQLINSFCYAWKDLKDDYIDYAYVRLIILKIKNQRY